MMRMFSHSHLLRRASVLAVVAAVALLVVGCGGGQGAEPTTSTGSTSAAGDVLSVEGTEFSFTPSTVKASAGQTTIRFTNHGGVEHDFLIDALDLHLHANPGKAAEATVTLTPGTYATYCSIPGHRESGMKGTLTVS
ncbi:MAG: cupredoxin domain-containing protein [Kineosporiaceae bacterium]|nr:cupredoxin domain-containing protein [Aeromicrobium sp.]